MEYHPARFRDSVAALRDFFTRWWGRHWFSFFLFSAVIYILFQKDITISLDLNTAGISYAPVQQEHTVEVPEKKTLQDSPSIPEKAEKTSPKMPEWKERTANNFSNLTFVLNPSYARRHGVDPAVVQEKTGACQTYIEQFVSIARKEREKYGVPISITLAQGLLESNAGESRLAMESKNHFGIKCRTKCRGCTCRNYSDDDIYDMFRVFDSAWESYREHSILLTGTRYNHLLELDLTDYEGWAYGLKKAGYATDKRYAEKLIQIIRFFDLDHYDRE